MDFGYEVLNCSAWRNLFHMDGSYLTKILEPLLCIEMPRNYVHQPQAQMYRWLYNRHDQVFIRDIMAAPFKDEVHSKAVQCVDPWSWLFMKKTKCMQEFMFRWSFIIECTTTSIRKIQNLPCHWCSVLSGLIASATLTKGTKTARPSSMIICDDNSIFKSRSIWGF